jgi:hypothetical protein
MRESSIKCEALGDEVPFSHLQMISGAFSTLNFFPNSDCVHPCCLRRSLIVYTDLFPLLPLIDLLIIIYHVLINQSILISNNF